MDSRRPAPRPRPSIRVNDPGSRRTVPPPRAVEDPLPAINLRSASRPRPSTRVDDPGSGHSRPSVPRPRPCLAPPPSRTVNTSPLPAIDSGRPAPRHRPSIQVDDPGSGRIQAIDSRRPKHRPRVDDPGPRRIQAVNSCPAPRLRRSIRSGATGVSASFKPLAAANKELEEAENEIQRLNELSLGDDISYEEYLGYLEQLPAKPDVDSSIELDDLQRKELNSRHASYRIKYHQLSRQVSEDNIYCDEEDGKLDWFFHPDYCKLAGLEDYQRLVPQNYGGYEYAGWDEYHRDCHSYEIELEYINYCEELSKKLKWIEAYLPNKSPSLKWGRILTRGTYQAIKLATDFSKISGGLAFSGFYEWLDCTTFNVCSFKELDGLYYEIWQRYTNGKKFRDALDEVYELNRFPLRQDQMKSALENDTFCSDLEEEFLACTTCLKDKAEVTEEKARELIAEALRKKTQKPKFYEDYCRKKIDIARAIGLISS